MLLRENHNVNTFRVEHADETNVFRTLANNIAIEHHVYVTNCYFMYIFDCARRCLKMYANRDLRVVSFV